jgi:amino acid permease
MIAETISLGILSLPSVLAAVGFVPGMILILGLGIIATYTGYTIGQFKMRYPHVHSMADAGEVMLGAFGRELFGAAQVCLLVFNMGSHILTFMIMMNTLTNHGTCTIVFGVIGLVLCYVCTLPRKLSEVSYLAIASFISITAAVTITMIGVGVGEGNSGHAMINITKTTTLRPAFLAVTNIIFAYAGHVAFFSFISELRDPTEYAKTLYLLQGVDTSMYLIVAAIIYNYAGNDVVSPALGSASPLVSKIAYGIAIPTIVIAACINGHVAAKYIYVRMFRGTGLMSEKSFRSYGSWALIALILWIIAWIVAEAIPVFNDLLSLISALFASWFTYGLSGVFWLYLNKGQYTKNGRKITLTVINSLIVAMGAAIVSPSKIGFEERVLTTHRWVWDYGHLASLFTSMHRKVAVLHVRTTDPPRGFSLMRALRGIAWEGAVEFSGPPSCWPVCILPIFNDCNDQVYSDP